MVHRRPPPGAGADAARGDDPDAPRRVGLLSVHTTPLAQPGAGDAGGMNVAIAALASHLVASGVEVHVFTRATDEAQPATVTTEAGYLVHHVSAGPHELAKHDLASHLCAFYLALAAHPAIGSLDLMHAHYWMSGWVARRLRTHTGMPFVQSFHTLGRAKNDHLAPGDVPEPPLRLAAEQRIVGDADAIIAPTPAEAQLLCRGYGAHPAQVYVAPLGVDLEVFRPDGPVDPRLAGPSPLILFAGRLQPLKGPDLAIRALAALDTLRGDPRARLVIVGGPSGSGIGTVDAPRLRLLAADLGVADRVTLLDPCPQSTLASLYRAADVVIMPSRTESFGLVALEAQATGTPVVAANVDGLHAALGPGAGRLVDGFDPASYAAAVADLLEGDTASLAGQAGVAFAARHGWDRAAAATRAVYRDVRSGVRPAALGAPSSA